MKSCISKDPQKYIFNNEKWIISLINVKSKSSKIVIEGLNNDNSLFIAEYYVFQSGLKQFNSSISQTISPDIGVIYTENSKYNSLTLEQRGTAEIFSWRISKERALKMMRAIKKELHDNSQQKKFESGFMQTKFFKNICQLMPELWCADVLATSGIKHEKKISTFFWWLNPDTVVVPGAVKMSNTSDIPVEITHAFNPNITHNNYASFWNFKKSIALGLATTLVTATAVYNFYSK